MLFVVECKQRKNCLCLCSSVESILATRRQHKDGSTEGIIATVQATAHDLFLYDLAALRKMMLNMCLLVDVLTWEKTKQNKTDLLSLCQVNICVHSK